MKVLVTGGSGYLGSRICEFFSIEGEHEVHRLSRKAPDSLHHMIFRPMVDWTDAETLRSYCDGIDAIVHTAGINAAGCIRDPQLAFEFNVGFTKKLLSAAIECSVNKFVYFSTAHVYGSPLVGHLTESAVVNPQHPYAVTRKAAEDLVIEAAERENIGGVVLRLSNAFGPPVSIRSDCWELVFNDLCKQAVEKKKLTLKTTGLQRRDFITISEVCRVVKHFLQLPQRKLDYSVFNVGGDWSLTIFDVAELISKRVSACLGFSPEIVRQRDGQMQTSEDLQYDRSRLQASGFIPIDNRISELDALVDFCFVNFSLPN